MTIQQYRDWYRIVHCAVCDYSDFYISFLLGKYLHD